MNDLEQIRAAIRRFRDERDWMQFHNPKDMATAIAIEAAELQEIFLWKSQSESSHVADVERQRVLEEVADLAIYLFELADNLKIDLAAAVQAKLTKNAQKYPVEHVRGSSKKYTEYSQKTLDAK
jgi:dCTP diphosphatase